MKGVAVSRQSNADEAEGYSQGYQDSRGLLRKLVREPGAYRQLAGAVDNPGAWKRGYRRGRRDGFHTTIRLTPNDRQEMFSAAA